MPSIPARPVIRPARPEDTPGISRLVRELAEYERAPDQVCLDDADLARALFCDSPKVFAHVAERNGTVQAMVVWFITYSTWTGRHAIYVEDLVVTHDARGQGLGRALLAELARLAVKAGYIRLQWSVLDWNEPAIGFYRHLGARPLHGWTMYRLDSAALEELAGSEPDGLAAPGRGPAAARDTPTSVTGIPEQGTPPRR